ncbi:DUF3179 domain-containing protein [Moorena sp. SIO3I8]|uniref:DUF3179 domain-containing protein n=1 Tax=Moorena sp. SIO3I8 TaxID=2607833 RepID=UPI0013BFE78E|nr:DUF3179 domain-containing protein [Moorena sp. SIO3I8]NEO06479.1 DUF3179 domain-containing protein [Moorena sp. SIO3I8]
MNKLLKIALSTTSLVGLCLMALVVQAGSWDNFKLRYFHLTAYLHNQDQEITDLQKQNLNPAKFTRINLTELLNGGPPKDGIPSIDNPKFDTAQTTPFSKTETVIGVVINGEAKAYPFGVMNWHELVNDTVGGVNVSVSYCPLCDTIVAFNRSNTTYGVTGKLYQSCLVMYDRADDTLYSQPWGMGIIGAKVNRNLKTIPAIKTTLGAWLSKYPNSKILSTDTGYNRDYFSYPYGSYYTDKRIIFPVRNQQRLTLHPKAIVSYVWEADQQTPKNQFSGASYQFVHDQLKKVGEKVVEFNGRPIRARWDSQLQTVLVEEFDGTPIPSSTAFAFVYPAYFGK